MACSSEGRNGKRRTEQLETVNVTTPGKDITAEDAPAHIFGYTILNDVSARDAQMVEMAGQLGPAKGKDFDTGKMRNRAEALRN